MLTISGRSCGKRVTSHCPFPHVWTLEKGTLVNPNWWRKSNFRMDSPSPGKAARSFEPGIFGFADGQRSRGNAFSGVGFAEARWLRTPCFPQEPQSCRISFPAATEDARLFDIFHGEHRTVIAAEVQRADDNAGERVAPVRIFCHEGFHHRSIGPERAPPVGDVSGLILTTKLKSWPTGMETVCELISLGHPDQVQRSKSAALRLHLVIQPIGCGSGHKGNREQQFAGSP